VAATAVSSLRARRRRNPAKMISTECQPALHSRLNAYYLKITGDSGCRRGARGRTACVHVQGKSGQLGKKWEEGRVHGAVSIVQERLWGGGGEDSSNHSSYTLVYMNTQHMSILRCCSTINNVDYSHMQLHARESMQHVGLLLMSSAFTRCSSSSPNHLGISHSRFVRLIFRRIFGEQNICGVH
jgi:hypothetical protein